MASLTRSWVRVLLVVSLAVNVFFVGAVATHWIGRGDRDVARERGNPALVLGLPSPRQLYGVLEKPEQDLLTAQWKARKPEFQETFREIFAARRAVADRLDAGNFEKAALETAFTDLRNAQMTLTATSQSMIADLAEELDADGRRRLADLMRPRKPAAKKE